MSNSPFDLQIVTASAAAAAAVVCVCDSLAHESAAFSEPLAANEFSGLSNVAKTFLIQRPPRRARRRPISRHSRNLFCFCFCERTSRASRCSVQLQAAAAAARVNHVGALCSANARVSPLTLTRDQIAHLCASRALIFDMANRIARAPLIQSHRIRALLQALSVPSRSGTSPDRLAAPPSRSGRSLTAGYSALKWHCTARSRAEQLRAR